MLFPESLRERIDAIVAGSETKQSALIPVLREVQNEFGHLSNESMEEAAGILGIPPSSVQNVASFYTMFFRKPVGEHVVWICRTLSCALRGAELVEHYVCDRLGVKTGETTADGKITVMEAECLASCGTAPVMLVDDKLEENLTKEKVDKLIEELRKS
ncbi:MAG: NADH-quinone oxidoreductase subunit NuoE [Thermodesulfobacteriota bacterium]